MLADLSLFQSVGSGSSSTFVTNGDGNVKVLNYGRPYRYPNHRTDMRSSDKTIASIQDALSVARNHYEQADGAYDYLVDAIEKSWKSGNEPTNSSDIEESLGKLADEMEMIRMCLEDISNTIADCLIVDKNVTEGNRWDAPPSKFISDRYEGEL